MSACVLYMCVFMYWAARFYSIVFLYVMSDLWFFLTAKASDNVVNATPIDVGLFNHCTLSEHCYIR